YLPLAQPLGALEVGLGDAEVRLRARDLGGDLAIVQPGEDHARLHLAALLDVHGQHRAADLCVDADGADRLDHARDGDLAADGAAHHGARLDRSDPHPARPAARPALGCPTSVAAGGGEGNRECRASERTRTPRCGTMMSYRVADCSSHLRFHTAPAPGRRGVVSIYGSSLRPSTASSRATEMPSSCRAFTHSISASASATCDAWRSRIVALPIW